MKLVRLVSLAKRELAEAASYYDSQVEGLGGHFLAVVEDGAHDLVFHGQRELEIVEQLADIRALAGIAGTDICIDRGAAEIRAEEVVTAGQVGHLEIGIHRMRLPAEEHDAFVALRRPGGLGEHALLGAFSNLETVETEGV